MEVKDKSMGRFHMTNKVNKIVSEALVYMDAETILGFSNLERVSFFTFIFTWWRDHGTKSPRRGQVADFDTDVRQWLHVEQNYAFIKDAVLEMGAS